MTRTEASTIRRAVKSVKADCLVITVGTGKHVSVMLEGRDAEQVASQLVAKGYTRSDFGGLVIDR